MHGPLTIAFDAPRDNVIRETLIQYINKDGTLVKVTTDRKYFSDGDYVDSQTRDPICEVGEN